MLFGLLLSSREDELLRSLHLLALVCVTNGFSLNQSLAWCLGQKDLKCLQDATLIKLESRHAIGVRQVICQVVHQRLSLGTVKDWRAGLVENLAGQLLVPINEIHLLSMSVTDLLLEGLILQEVGHNLLGKFLD